ncbi:hypothetical protein ACVQ9Z_12560 [Staphylococcus aureus]
MKEVGFGTLNWVAVIIYLSYVVHWRLFLPSASQFADSFFTAVTSLVLGSWLFNLCYYVKCDYIYVYTRESI